MNRKRIRIYPYKMGSKGAKALKRELVNRGHNVLLVKPDGRYRPRRNDLIINWGKSIQPNWVHPLNGQWLNDFICVQAAGNKLTAFEIMKEAGVSIPEFTDSSIIAGNWVDNSDLILCRSKLTGHSGEGITIYNTPEERANNDVNFPEVPLYVKYIKKSAEYRVHIFNGEVIDVQKKKKRQETPNEEVDYKVRSYQNGWVFCREDINYDDQVIEESKKAVGSLGLDFGAVDVIWNEHYQKAYVLEVNTAPGLEGTTLINYADAIEQELNRDE